MQHEAGDSSQSQSPRPALVREFAKVVRLSPHKIEDALVGCLLPSLADLASLQRKALAKLEERVKEQDGLKLAQLNDSSSDSEEVRSDSSFVAHEPSGDVCLCGPAGVAAHPRGAEAARQLSQAFQWK
eukprot:767746-Hanusia_phi.AAC.3